MDIVININRNYLMVALVMLKSIFENNGQESIIVHLLHSTLEKSDIEILQKFIEESKGKLRQYRIEPTLFNEFPHTGRWSLETYYRLLIADKLADTVEKVLYLDADIVVDGCLKELIHMDFNGHSIIACENMDGLIDIRQKNMDWGRSIKTKYFNAGVMVMNLKKIRTICDFDLYRRLAIEWKNKIPMLDQDLLNIVFSKDTKYIDSLKYNHIVDLSSNMKKTDTIIYHYATSKKPWMLGRKACINKVAYEKWWAYARKITYWNLREEKES